MIIRLLPMKLAILLMVGGFTHALAQSENWETLNTAGILAYQENDFVTAKELFERALLTLELKDQTDPHAATTFNNLAAVHKNLGEIEQAELRYRNSLAVIEKIQGPNHPDVAMGLNNLAALYFSQQALGKAEPLWKRALQISERILGNKHPHLVQPLMTLGMVSQAQRKFDKAEAFYIRAIRIAEQALKPDHPGLLPLYVRYEAMLRQTNRGEEADVMKRKIESLQLSKNPLQKEP